MKPLPMRLGDLSVGFVQALADAVRDAARPRYVEEPASVVEVGRRGHLRVLRSIDVDDAAALP